MNRSINFWSGETNFSETVRDLSSSFLATCSVTTEKVKEKLKLNKDRIIEESTAQLNSTIRAVTSKVTNFNEVDYDDSAYVVPVVEQGLHPSMEQAYKSAYEEASKKADKLETQAIGYIEKMKSVNERLLESTLSKQKEIVDKSHEMSLSIIENNGSPDTKVSSDGAEFCKTVRKFPPPKYFEQNNRSAASLLIFLNEEINEYCEEVPCLSLNNKCYVVRKIFEGDTQESENFHEKTKIFFAMDKIVEGIKDYSLNEKHIYLNLVQFLYHTSPSFEMTERKPGQSWVVYFKKQWTLKHYCNESLTDTEIADSIVLTLIESPKLLNTSKEVLLKFNMKFKISQMIGNVINKNELIAFAMELDAFYSDAAVHESCRVSAPQQDDYHDSGETDSKW